MRCRRPRLKEANTALAAGGEAARDNIVKLRGEVDGLAGKTAAAQTAHDAAAKIVDDETGPWAEGAELAQQLRGLTAGSPTLLQNGAEALDPSKISSKKLAEQEAGAADSLAAAKEAVQKAARQLYPDGQDDSKKLAEKALAAVPAADEEDEAKKPWARRREQLATTFVGPA